MMRFSLALLVWGDAPLEAELDSIQEYMETAEASNENLDWQCLDLKEFSEIVQATGESL